MKKWIQAARLRTLPLSVSGIIMGMAGAYPDYHHKDNFYVIFILCILTTLFLQVVSNYANDYGDAVKGTDNEDRVGPKRAVQSGVITASEMKRAIAITSFMALLCALGVIFSAFGTEHLLKALGYFVLGLACVYAAIKYTVGNSAYGYKGLGDLFVFIFFGWVSTLGSYFLYGLQMNWNMLLPASSIGFLSMAVLNMNNMRDIENDAVMGKNTMVVKMGFNKARMYHFSIIMLAIVGFNTFAMLKNFQWYEYFYCLAYIPLIKNLKKVNSVTDPRALDSELKRISLSTFFIVVLMAIILILK